MAATVQDLQRMLEDAWDNHVSTANTLREELRLNERAVGALVSTGSVVSVSKNSASQSYAFSGGGSLTTAEVARAWRDLITLHDSSSDALVSAGQTPTDETIYAEMRARCQPVYSSQPNMQQLRVQP